MARPKTQFGDWKFDDLLQRLVQVPRAEIERRLKAEQKAKEKLRARRENKQK
jgi:hypothetical protein